MGGFGGGGGRTPPPSGIRPLTTQRVPLCTILRQQCLVTDPKNFLRAPSAPIYSNFERGARAEKARLIGQNLPKSV